MMVAHSIDPSTQEAETSGFLSSRPAWSTKGIPGQLKLHSKPLSKTNKKTLRHFQQKYGLYLWKYKTRKKEKILCFKSTHKIFLTPNSYLFHTL